MPIAGEPADVYQALQSAHAVLAASSYPKLLFTGEPGALVAPEFAERFAASLKHLRAGSSRRRPAFPPGGSPRGDRALRRRLDRGHRGGAPAACGLSRTLPPNDVLIAAAGERPQ